MFAYISKVRAPLPSIAARNVFLGKKRLEGMATSDECAVAIKESWDYISEHKAMTDSKTPEFTMVRATMWLILDHWEPRDHISEVLDWFLFMVNKFEDHSDVDEALIEKFFSL